jgi:thioredoxin reductase/Pyruvate/2-oxoacid:ferredoxin oxidoreductase delta subunit
VIVATAVAVPLLVAAAQALGRARKQRVSTEELQRDGERLPPTLHPVIDPDICIGSLACLKSCPEGDILGMVDGTARLIRGDHCIGHGRCAAECPVGAITLVFGTAERGLDLPMVDQFFESSRPGVHIVGELGGMGLIKNAIIQGIQVGERLAKVMPPPRREHGTVDVAIVGAGPAGLATALTLRGAGKTFRVLDQGTLGGTIAQYPRQKVVMTEAVRLPIHGKFGRKRISKEELLATWQHALQKGNIQVEEGVKVTGIEGRDGAFSVQTSAGPVSARKVVLATGRRGTPRKLGVPGEDLPNVTYTLIDPEQYQGCRVLVVGGGDSALEAACQLAEAGGVKVAISYRGDAFSRAREANRARIGQLISERKVRAVMSSQVEKILEDEVVLTASGSPLVLGNDYVIASLGGELPLQFLANAGISLKRHFGEAPGSHAPGRQGLARRDLERRKSHRTRWLYAATGFLILAWLALQGWDYYLLPKAARLHSPLHATLRPAGHWGHGVGVVATAFMLSNFIYPLRKRSRFLSGIGRISDWLDFHTFVGFMSPLVIAFHAAFQSNNQLATGTAAALLVVVLTGIIGRYIYGLVPSAGGKLVELGELAGKWERLRERLRPLLQESDGSALLQHMFDRAVTPAKGGSLLFLFVRMPFMRLRGGFQLFRARMHFSDHDDFEEFAEAFGELEKIRVQVAFYGSLKRLLRAWRLFHGALAVFLVVAIAAHIAVSLYLGYRWIL